MQAMQQLVIGARRGDARQAVRCGELCGSNTSGFGRIVGVRDDQLDVDAIRQENLRASHAPSP
jgi:hypothetical protein